MSIVLDGFFFSPQNPSIISTNGLPFLKKNKKIGMVIMCHESSLVLLFRTLSRLGDSIDMVQSTAR